MPDVRDDNTPVNYEDLKLVPANMASLQINAWTPAKNGQGAATQVHLILNLEAPLNDIGIVLRFKGPDTLGVLIQQLQRYKQEVFG